LNGALASLVVITAGPDLFNHSTSMIIGAICGALVVISVPMLDKLKIDDLVGAISVYLFAGIWSTLCVGIFGEGSITIQIIGIMSIGAFVVVASSIVWLILKVTIGIRIDEKDEVIGSDMAECGMEAYPEFGGSSKTV
jgi:Amt family ammonium transporter